MPLLSFRSITKRFPGVLALDGVSFDIERGSCHALVGENGAGKSTLGKILAGVYVTDEGEIQLDGKPVQPVCETSMITELEMEEEEPWVISTR